jgi:class 3 adenylate cyclase
MDFVESADPDAGMDRTGRDMVHLAPPALQADLLRTMYSTDVSALLPRLTMPVTVLHGRGDRLIPFAEGRALAAGLPHAEFVPIEGNTGAALTERDATIPAIRRALSMQPAAQARTSTMRTVLFTDLVGHTEMMQRLGDAKGRDVLREHERITRETLRAHGGAEVKTMGDGFMASFGSVTSAVECAVALQRAFQDFHSPTSTFQPPGDPPPLAIRVGLNAGEPIEEDGDLFGATVILASRIAAQAGAGEILVPDTVRGLLAGKGFVFADRGEFVPRGFDDATRLFEVRWRE